MKKLKTYLYLKVFAVASVLLVFYAMETIPRRSYLEPDTSIDTDESILYTPQGKLNASTREYSPLEKIRVWMEINYNDEEARRISTMYWPEHMAPSSPKDRKTILYYTDFWNRDDFGIGEGSAIFEEMGCPFSNCFATYNRSLVRLEDADAVIWHPLGRDKTLPERRSKHTRMVFYLTEPIPYSHQEELRAKRFRNFFNYTMTISRTADIFDPYGIIIKRNKPFSSDVVKNFAHGKTKMAVWFSSHCGTQSNREKVVKMIQKFFKVDVYGECGIFRCTKNEFNQNDENCMKKIEKEYKFYLAFENSLCKEYISEKFFDAMKHNIIPVVYGIGNYEEIAPPHSYINILSFKNIKAAVDHMIYLSNNDTAYNEYFWWKSHYKVLTNFMQKKTPEYKHISWCSLCKKLHTDTQVKSYSRIRPFASIRNCLSADHTFMLQFFEEKDALAASTRYLSHLGF